MHYSADCIAKFTRIPNKRHGASYSLWNNYFPALTAQDCMAICWKKYPDCSAVDYKYPACITITISYSVHNLRTRVGTDHYYRHACN